MQLRDIESDKIRERYKIEKKQVEEEEEESEDEDDSFGPKKSKEEDTDDPVARKFLRLPLRQWRHARCSCSAIFFIYLLAQNNSNKIEIVTLLYGRLLLPGGVSPPVIFYHRNVCTLFLGRWVAKLVAPACYSDSLGSNPDISQKYKMGDISKGVANTL